MSPKMGWKPNHFTTPGLERLALLEDSEILEDPAPGTYTLGRATDLEPTVPKLITFNEGEMAISLEGEGANCGRVLSSVQVRRRTEIVTDGSTLVGSNLMKPDDGNTCIETPAGEVVYRDDARTVTVVQLDADKALLSVS